jgi:urate oxidase/2-oxo-4-hydroxy-4-carboxy-5-ureidoimidazoline decarboxylase
MADAVAIGYGKEAVSVYRTDGVRTLFAAEVRLLVRGERLLSSYTEGDNSLVVATDSMKNFVHVHALGYDGSSLEDFLLLLGQRFLDHYGQADRVELGARDLPFSRQGEAAFQRTYGDRGVAELTLDRDGIVEERSGREGLHLVKLTGSSFAGFVRDEYTTLPESHDRPLFVHLDVHWRHVDFPRRPAGEDVRDSVVETFAGFESASIQELVHEMGVRVLERFAEIGEVSFAAQNRLWDTAQVSEEDERVRVYTDPRPPYGAVELTLRR